jgi:hypothetical protein
MREQIAKALAWKTARVAKGMSLQIFSATHGE